MFFYNIEYPSLVTHNTAMSYEKFLDYYSATPVEYYTDKKDHPAYKYNRCLAFEIRGPMPIPRKEIPDLRIRTPRLYGGDIENSTDNPTVIALVSQLARREPVPYTPPYPVQLIIFCPMMYVDKLFTSCSWVADLLVLSPKSWYFGHFIRGARLEQCAIRYDDYCRTHAPPPPP